MTDDNLRDAILRVAQNNAEQHPARGAINSFQHFAVVLVRESV
jgi:hypothetical protein